MSSIFSSPSTPDIPPQPEQQEPVQVIEEDAAAAREREKKKLAPTGQRSTILSGIMAALKKRLGE